MFTPGLTLIKISHPFKLYHIIFIDHMQVYNMHKKHVYICTLIFRYIDHKRVDIDNKIVYNLITVKGTQQQQRHRNGGKDNEV